MRLALVFLASLAQAQVTSLVIDPADSRRTSASAITLEHESNGLSAHGFRVNVVATGAWTLTLTGTCPSWEYQWPVVSGTGNATLDVWKHTGTTEVTAVGTTSCTIIATAGAFSQTLTLTEIVLPRLSPVYTNFKRVADSALGCSKTSTGYEAFDICPVADTFPGGNWVPMTVGETRTDPNFGGRITRFADRVSQTYSTIGAVSPNANFFHMGQGHNADVGLYTSDGVKRYSATNVSSPHYHPTLPGVFYLGPDGNLQGSRLIGNPGPTANQAGAGWLKRITCTLPNCTSVSEATVYTHPSRPIRIGGSGNSSPDGYFGFWSVDEVNARVKEVCVFSPWTETAKCAPLSALTAGEPLVTDASMTIDDALKCQVTMGKDDEVTYIGLRVPNGNPSTANAPGWFIWYFRNFEDGLTLLTPSGVSGPDQAPAAGVSWSIDPAVTTRWFTGAHADMVTANGHAYYVPSSAFRGKYYYDHGMGALDLTNLRKNGFTSKLGQKGGLFWTGIGSRPAAEYPSAAVTAPLLAISDFDKAVPGDGYQIINVTISGGTQATITTGRYNSAFAHGWNVGDQVAIYNVGGISGFNAKFTTVAGTTGSTVVVNGTFSGTYTANTGGIVKAAALAWQPSNYFEMQVARFGPRGVFTVRRLAKIRGIGYSGCADPYGEQFTRSKMFYDGSKVIGTENHGLICYGGAHLYETGFELDKDTPSRHFSRRGDGFEVQPGETSAVIDVRYRGGAACTLNWGPTLALANSVSVPPAARRVRLTGLSAGTLYFARVVCDNFDVAFDEFTTTPAATGTKTIALGGVSPPGTTDIQIEYGATEALGSTTTAAACSPSGPCSQTVTGSPGAPLYYRVVWLASGARIRAGAVTAIML